MLNDSPASAGNNSKEAFQAALAAQDWQMAIEIGGQMKKGIFSFMEQIDLLLQLSLLDAQTATKLLYTNAFSHTFVMIGLTLPNVTPLQSSPYYVPEMASELKKALVERRKEDADKIRKCGQWCINPVAIAEIAELEEQLLAYAANTYLPLQTAASVPASINQVTSPDYKPRRFTH